MRAVPLILLLGGCAFGDLDRRVYCDCQCDEERFTCDVTRKDDIKVISPGPTAEGGL